MRLLQHMSHRSQITLTGAVTAGFVLAISAVVFLIFDWRFQRQQLLIERTATTQVVASNVAAAMLFDDVSAARETITPLAALESIDHVIILDREGQVFVGSGSARIDKEASDATTGFVEKGLYSVADINTEGDIVGTLIVRSNLKAFNETMWSAALLVLCIFILGLGLAALIARSLSAFVMKPVERLSNTMTEVRSSGDLSKRVTMASSLEFSQLASNFNALLDQLQTNDTELRSAMHDLVVARDEARSANVAKSRFLANMSHELRTPLNAIIGYSALLAEDFEGDDQSEALEDVTRINKAGEHLLSLINDVLDLSKIEAGKMELENSTIELDGFVEDVLNTLGHAPKRNNNALIVEIDPDAVAVSADRMRLRQCLLNLLSNACKFTEDGTITLRASRGHREGGDVVEFQIEDTGVGMTEDQARKLFNAFVQADSSVTRQFGGTGLGLAITRQLALAMGGGVSLTSHKGEGSVFTLWVPAARTSPASIASVKVQKTSEQYEKGKPLALIVEDDADCAELLKRQLVAKGYECIVCAEGSIAMDMARARAPDIIFLDLYLPGRSGREILRDLAEDEELFTIPVVVVSVDDDRGRSLRDGACEHIVKPFNEQHLSHVLQAFGSGSRGELLVVEPDAEKAVLIQGAAEKAGWSPVVVASVSHIDQLADSFKPAAVAIGSCQPDDLSLEWVIGFRQQKRFANTPVLVISELPLSESLSAPHSSGVDIVLEPDGVGPTAIVRSLVDLRKKRRKAS